MQLKVWCNGQWAMHMELAILHLRICILQTSGNHIILTLPYHLMVPQPLLFVSSHKPNKGINEGRKKKSAFFRSIYGTLMKNYHILGYKYIENNFIDYFLWQHEIKIQLKGKNLSSFFYIWKQKKNSRVLNYLWTKNKLRCEKKWKHWELNGSERLT